MSVDAGEAARRTLLAAAGVNLESAMEGSTGATGLARLLPLPLRAAGRQRRRHTATLLPAAGWHVDAKYDSLYWTLATFVWWTYAAKLVPQLRWADNAQHIIMGAAIVGMAVLSTLRPAAYRLHGPLLRLLLLVYGYCMPVLTSVPVMDAFTPAPSKVAYFGGLLDTYSLWLSSRNAFLSWALLGCRPPLHIALPLQLWGLWRITAAGFCSAPVLRHPVMEERTELAHAVLNLGYSICSAGPRAMDALCPPTPYQRCLTLLAFYNSIFAVLLPLLLLVPLRQVDLAAGGELRAQSCSTKVDACIEACLRPLMWPALLGRRQQRRGAHRRNAAAAEELPTFSTLLLRWYLVLMLLWTACCLLS